MWIIQVSQQSLLTHMRAIRIKCGVKNALVFVFQQRSRKTKVKLQPVYGLLVRDQQTIESTCTYTITSRTHTFFFFDELSLGGKQFTARRYQTGSLGSHGCTEVQYSISANAPKWNIHCDLPATTSSTVRVRYFTLFICHCTRTRSPFNYPAPRRMANEH